jgi:hypothetical protein
MKLSDLICRRFISEIREGKGMERLLLSEVLHNFETLFLEKFSPSVFEEFIQSGVS